MPGDPLIRGEARQQLGAVLVDLPVGHKIRLDHAFGILHQKGAGAEGIVVHATKGAGFRHEGAGRDILADTDFQFIHH